MLRTAVITCNFPNREQPHRGHSTYQVLRILSRWMNVQVFCPTPIYPSWWKPRKFVFPQADSTYSPGDVPVQYLGYRAVPGLSRPSNGFAAARAVFPYVKDFRPELILNYAIYPDGIASIVVGKKLHAPVVLCATGSDIHSIPDPLTRRLTQWALRRASWVNFVSEDLRKRGIHLGAPAERTRAILNGVDTTIFHVKDRQAARRALGLEVGCRLILFVGWLARHKGIEELMRAFTSLAPYYQGLKLACIGDGVLKQRLDTGRVRERNVLFPGRCTSPEVSLWMAAADVVCLPSYAEGCPNVVLEALASGRPIVASAVGGIPEVVNERNAILVPPRDVPRLTQALAAALERDWEPEAISQHYTRSWYEVATEWFETCQLVVSANPGSRDRA